jgi:MFS transporter, DHA2 family, multidrug resistance protein
MRPTTAGNACCRASERLFLVPVNLAAYSQLRPDQNNRASSMTNLLRNWGGSFGIAFVTTESVRRQSFHQSNLVAHLDSGSGALQQASHGANRLPDTAGFTNVDANAGALGVIYRQIAEQSQFLSFMDCFRVFGWTTLAMIPAILAIRKFRPGASAPVGD